MGFGRKRRGGFRRAVRRITRRGCYEMVFTDLSNQSDSGQGNSPGGLARFIAYPTGTAGAWAQAEQGDAAFSPPLELITNPNQFVVKVSSGEGWTTFIPLWDVPLSNKHGEHAYMHALRGYLQPCALLVKDQSGILRNTNQVFRIRLAIMKFSLGRDDLLTSGAPATSVPAKNIFMRETLRERVYWMRDWLIPANSDQFNYWSKQTVSYEASRFGNEPKLSCLNGSNHIRIKRVGSLRRNDWPFLAIGVQGQLDTINMTTNSGNSRTLIAASTLAVGINGWVRAYVSS